MIPLIVATLAPIINCIQLFPQLYKTYVTKSVKDLSLYSLLLILTTNILWLLHGYFIFDLSLIVSGVISMIINTTLLTLYFLYRKEWEITLCILEWIWVNGTPFGRARHLNTSFFLLRAFNLFTNNSYPEMSRILIYRCNGISQFFFLSNRL